MKFFPENSMFSIYMIFEVISKMIFGVNRDFQIARLNKNSDI